MEYALQGRQITTEKSECQMAPGGGTQKTTAGKGGKESEVWVRLSQ